MHDPLDREVLAQEDQLTEATRTLDIGTLDRLYADDIMFTGVICTKSNLMDEARPSTPLRPRARDLHFHDLRREFASRLLESSADVHDVQIFLGHAAITTTSRYLQSTPVRLERALARMERSARLRHDSGRPTRKTNQKVAGARTENAGKTVN